jgi:hypothetical protein
MPVQHHRIATDGLAEAAPRQSVDAITIDDHECTRQYRGTGDRTALSSSSLESESAACPEPVGPVDGWVIGYHLSWVDYSVLPYCKPTVLTVVMVRRSTGVRAAPSPTTSPRSAPSQRETSVTGGPSHTATATSTGSRPTPLTASYRRTFFRVEVASADHTPLIVLPGWLGQQHSSVLSGWRRRGSHVARHVR